MVEFLIITISCLSIYTIFTVSYAVYDMRKNQINENEEIATVVDEISNTNTRNTNEIENIGDVIIYNNECPICLEDINYEDGCMLKCNHAYHQDCIHQWMMFSKNNICPLMNAILVISMVTF